MVNQLARRTVPTAHIVAVESGQQGLPLTYRSRSTERTVVAWAVQTNLFGAGISGTTRSARVQHDIARVCPSISEDDRHRRRPDDDRPVSLATHRAKLDGLDRTLPAERQEEPVGPFVQTTSTGRAVVDVTDVAAVLELLDEQPADPAQPSGCTATRRTGSAAPTPCRAPTSAARVRSTSSGCPPSTSQ